MSSSTRVPIVDVRDVTKTFTSPGGSIVRAVSNLSMHVAAGETVALIGESGSGKTTVGKLMLGLMQPDSGQVLFEGTPLNRRSPREALQLRGRLQVVFQEPYESLNPRRKVGSTIEEPLIVQRSGDTASRRARVREVLDLVGLSSDLATRYPGELSGGQQQRVGIARAIVGRPRVIVLDEPTASLDRTIRRQITDLLLTLQRQLDLGYLLITHDIASVRRIADRAVVLFRGEQVETGPTTAVLSNPAHPYTKALISAELPGVPGSMRQRFRLLPTVGAATSTPRPGCPLQPVCPYRAHPCAEEDPPMFDVGGGHAAACFRWPEVTAPDADPPTDPVGSLSRGGPAA